MRSSERAAIDAVRCVGAHDVAMKLLALAFPDELREIPPANSSRRINLTGFQARGVSRAHESIRTWGGVLLCDSVGLGKTYMGLSLVKDFVRNGSAVHVVIPASLRKQWLHGLTRAGIPAHAVTLLTHAQLSRGCHAPDARRTGLVLVDEAHAFRNPRTRRYAGLTRLAAGSAVCLMTATPVNNSLLDLYWLLRVWAGDDAFHALGVSHLRALFLEMEQRGSATAAFARLMRAVMIRRTRADVRDEVTGTLIRFPVLAPPVPISYEPDHGCAGSHQFVLESIASLRLIVLHSTNRSLLRYVLLKRLESSSSALRATLDRMRHYYVEFINAIDEGLALRASDIDAVRFSASGQLYFRKLVLEKLSPSTCASELRAAAAADVALMDAMLERISIEPHTDDKLQRLAGLVFGQLAACRVLVFTEFRETASWLWRNFAARGGVAMISGDAAMLGRGRSSRTAVLDRFAYPVRASRHHARELVRVLIATDVLAEGLNLQECAHVVSYDLPWNPVRLIQRIGRIDRLGSPHDTVYAYNFVPGHHLESYLAILRRLRIKLHAMALGLGADHPVLGMPDATRSDDSWRHLSDTAHGRIPPPQADSSALEERLRARLRACRTHPDTDEATPLFARIISRPPNRCGLYVAVIACSSHLRAYRLTEHELEEVDPLELADRCLDASPSGSVITRGELHAIRRALRRVRAAAFSDSTPVNPAGLVLSSARTAARALHHAMCLEPGGPERGDAAEAERLLEILSRPLDPGAEARLRVCRIDPRAGLRSVLQILDGCLSEAARARSGPEFRAAGPPGRTRGYRLICAVSAV